MPKQCRIPNCVKDTNTTLFNVPSNAEIREKWLSAVRGAYPNLVIGKTLFICEKHFKHSDIHEFHEITDATGQIIERVPVTRKRLKTGAVPYFVDSPSLASNDSRTIIPDVSDQPRPRTSDIVPLTHVVSSRTNAPLHDLIRTDSSRRWMQCDIHFDKAFKQNDFGLVCNICDRLWFSRDLKVITAKQVDVIATSFAAEAENDKLSSYKVCNTCCKSLNKGKIPNLAKINGFQYPPKPLHLPSLDPITERLISPRLPFMQIRRLRREGAYAIVGQIINVPVDVNTMITLLPRRLDDDQAFNVNIKRNLIHKSTYLQGFVRKSIIKAWLSYLIETPLYRLYNIKVDFSILDGNPSADNVKSAEQSEDSVPLMEHMHVEGDEQVPESEVLLARQQTLFWNEDLCLDIAPGACSTPMNLLYDRHAEELSFPGIYYGVPRSFNENINVTPYMIATSEIRRRDRRGVTPSHILYMAMKILRHRVVDGLYSTFKSVDETVSITRRMLENKQFVDDCVNKDLAFFKSIPNSMQYWADRKKDLFAMMRQLGKPTMFMTLSANEIRWPHLLAILHKLSDQFPDIQVEPLVDLSRSQRCDLVNEDPVTCCIYFNKLVDVIMTMLQSRTQWNPFGQYRVIDYFKRIEFQQRGSPHAHILLWLNNDPKEAVSENMSKTIELVQQLCSVNRHDLPEPKYGNQVHQHTFTCTKRGETSCRFSIPYWPMQESRVLLPMPKEDGRRGGLRLKAVKIREILEQKLYDSFEAFLDDNKLTWDSYLDIIRSSLLRPTLIFKRALDEIYTNTFHPWIGSVLNSNMDLQFILDEYSCAAYVVEYVNKSERGMSNLHRHLLQLDDESFCSDYGSLLKRVGLKLLNMVEMSSQEAAWYLLRQPMSHCSRQVVYIPTVWPHERQKCCKKRATMNRENISPDSTDIWTKNIIQQYEERPSELENLDLADFVAKYSPSRSSTRTLDNSSNEEDTPRPKRRRVQYDDLVEGDDNNSINQEDGSDTNIDDIPDNKKNVYVIRKTARVIRYRHYDIDDVENYKREMVLLYMPFRNEHVDILDRNKFIQIYDDNEQLILERRRAYEANIDINQVMTALKELCLRAEEPQEEKKDTHEQFVSNVLGNREQENMDDIDMITSGKSFSIVRRRTNVMPKQEYCELLRTTNVEQRELILEVIHRLHTPDANPLQIFFTGPAGCGKTYVLKAIMETINRYTQHHNSLRNAYIVCASTGKAAVNLCGTTVHSVFSLGISKRMDKHGLSPEQLHNYRNLFSGIKFIIIDEISMIGAHILQGIHSRLQDITAVHDQPFGGMNIIFCGDLRQLPAVNSQPIYKPSRNAIGGAILWQSLDYFPLTRVVRQQDATFSNILTKIGNGKQLSQSETELIESRFRTIEWCDENLPDVIRLYHSNEEVNQYNKRRIQSCMECVAHDVMIGFRTISEMTNARTKLHKLSVVQTHGLPYILSLAQEYPYMLTSNIDLEDGLVNGIIGQLMYIEMLDDYQHQPIAGPSTSRGEETDSIRSPNLRVWLLFENKFIGEKARIKCRPHVIANQHMLQLNWTPIHKSTATISLISSIKCKRTQLPLIPACAITIHKSQGGTFDEIVFQYNSKQPTQLVYVALSRVTTIEGLYITNATKNFKFSHGQRDTSEALKNIRNEYERLEQHRLCTLTRSAETFFTTPTSNQHSSDIMTNTARQIFIVNMNVQSLRAHTSDISTDSILQRAEYLVCSETWMESTQSPTEIHGFTCESHQNNCMSTERRLAGGIAIFKNVECFTTCTPISQITNQTHFQSKLVGDFTSVEVLFNNNTKFVLAGVYIHPNVPTAEIQLFLFQSMIRYTDSIKKIFPTIKSDKDTPIILCGDFNCDFLQNETLLNYMKTEFNLECCNTQPTTLGNTRLDLTFTRNIHVDIFRYVSYFSYHRPIINKVILNY